MYFRSTPDSLQKRLMTEPEAIEAEKQWSETYAWRSSMRRLRSAAASLGIGDAAFDEVRAITDSDAKALDILLSEFVADNQGKSQVGFALGLKIGLARQEGWSPRGRLVEYFRHQLGEWVGRDFVVGVEVYDPLQWPAPPAGEHCRRLGAAIYEVARALSDMPLPCGDDCTCDWRPTFRTDPPRGKPILLADLPAGLRRRRPATAA